MISRKNARVRVGTLRNSTQRMYQELRPFIVDLRIDEILQTGAARKPYLPGGESVYLFLDFTMIIVNYKDIRTYAAERRSAATRCSIANAGQNAPPTMGGKTE